MEPDSEKPTKKLEGRRICVVEDDRFFQEIIQRKLSEAGAKVEIAENGEQGLNLAARGEFDLIILDLLLPGMDGFEFLRRRKKDQKTAKIPVMVLSNLGDPDQIKNAQGLSVGAYLVKAAVSVTEIVDEAAKLCPPKPKP